MTWLSTAFVLLSRLPRFCTGPLRALVGQKIVSTIKALRYISQKVLSSQGVSRKAPQAGRPSIGHVPLAMHKRPGRKAAFFRADSSHWTILQGAVVAEHGTQTSNR